MKSRAERFEETGKQRERERKREIRDGTLILMKTWKTSLGLEIGRAHV